MKLNNSKLNSRSKLAYQKFLEYIKSTNYNYDNAVYINTQTKITITCKTHGDFNQTPANHIRGQGCPKCKFDKVAKHNRLTKEEFINKAKKIHKDTYKYEKINYINIMTKVLITCKEHGDFLQIPVDHLAGKGCNLCAIKNQIIAQTLSPEEFIEKANKVHNNKYTYFNAKYTKMQNYVVITCPIHGDFKQKAANHTQGQGCPTCGNLAKQKKYHKYPTILYMIFFTNLNLYKLGITMEKRGLKTRYIGENEPYEVCQKIVFPNGKLAYTLEQKLLCEYKNFSYKGPNVLKAGNTELFTENVLLKHLT